MTWSCPNCPLTTNDDSEAVCAACGTRRPGHIKVRKPRTRRAAAGMACALGGAYAALSYTVAFAVSQVLVGAAGGRFDVELICREAIGLVGVVMLAAAGDSVGDRRAQNIAYHAVLGLAVAASLYSDTWLWGTLGCAVAAAGAEFLVDVLGRRRQGRSV